MASSRVMASTSPANQDLRRHQSFIRSDQSSNLGSMNMEDLLKNIYDEAVPPPVNFPSGGDGKSVDDVWKEIVAGNGGGNSGGQPEMTLEDYLRKAGAVREEDVVKLPPAPAPTVIPGYGAVFDPMIGSGAGSPSQVLPPQPHMQFGSPIVTSPGISGGGRGKRNMAVEDVSVDKGTQQKQRRMIKNRESAARSRERKQAYTVELESLVTQLEEENARLIKEEAELNKDRFKQLMEHLIPVAEKRRPPRVLRRTNSM